MKRLELTIVLFLLLGVMLAMGGLLLRPEPAGAHCQIPCGIYYDKTLFDRMETDIDTIEKSMRTIQDLSADPDKNANQLIRWVMNKEDHADQFATAISAYFLQQRIKPEEMQTDKDAYLRKLTLCHKLLVTAMQCKQTTDLQHAADLRTLLQDFKTAYRGNPEHAGDHSEPKDHGHTHKQ